ncbi:hypothetical protein CGH67_28945, partial [Vibrio parahaemolyticus]
LKDTFEYLGKDTNKILDIYDIQWDDLSLFCDQIEKQQVRDWHNSLLDKVSVSMVSDIIDEAIHLCNRKHAILLCDDAALVLTKDYMVEFFDIFRALKSAKIS